MTTFPKRIQRQRTSGWRMPADAIYVGRPSKWGNPFNWKDDCCPRCPEISRANAVHKFSEMVQSQPLLMADIQRELAGKDLACWCPLDQPCHADVLIAIANR